MLLVIVLPHHIVCKIHPLSAARLVLLTIHAKKFAAVCLAQEPLFLVGLAPFYL